MRIFEAEHVIVRLLEDSDLNAFYGLTKQSGILEMQGMRHVKDKASAKKLLADTSEEKRPGHHSEVR
jgi:hypothetical protein